MWGLISSRLTEWRGLSPVLSCAKQNRRRSHHGDVLIQYRGPPVCLAIPGKIIEIREEHGSRAGRIEFGGIFRQVSLDFVPEAQVGDYVMVHVGFAISRVDADEAQKTYELLEELGALEDELPPEPPSYQ
jgi:hydrogenase expression/formation protein HypC